jgi:hypothetical protein
MCKLLLNSIIVNVNTTLPVDVSAATSDQVCVTSNFDSERLSLHISKDAVLSFSDFHRRKNIFDIFFFAGLL